MSEIDHYIRATTVQTACSLLENPGNRAIAGGTDIILRSKRYPEPSLTLVDIGDIEELRGVTREADGVRIGAATRLSEVVRADALQGKAFRALIQGAVQVGSPQIRNLATIGGNICNAAPSADTAAPLLVLDGCAEIVSSRGFRTVPLVEFFKGPGKTVLEPGELLRSIFLPNPQPGAETVYFKHCPRRAMDLAVVGVAVSLAPQDRRSVRIGLGAVAPTPIRAYEAERCIAAAPALDRAVIDEAARLAAEAARPISDVRASAAYRKEMVGALTRRAFQQIMGIE